MEFLTTWKNIPAENEYSSIINVSTTADVAEKKLEVNNIFTIAHRTVNDQELIYLSASFINSIKVLAELKISPGTNISVWGSQHKLLIHIHVVGIHSTKISFKADLFDQKEEMVLNCKLISFYWKLNS